jgi:hypothetical protein
MQSVLATRQSLIGVGVALAVAAGKAKAVHNVIVPINPFTIF